MSGRAATPAPAWRLLLSEPLDGVTNMAVDEALWRGRLSGEGLPTVRFFGWAPPAISIGYGQRRDARLNLAACRRGGLGPLRPPTGGSAIYHDRPPPRVPSPAARRARGFAATAAAMAEGFTRAHGIELRPGGLTRQEQELVDRLVRDKYGTAEWNERGRLATDLSRVS